MLAIRINLEATLQYSITLEKAAGFQRLGCTPKLAEMGTYLEEVVTH